MRDAIGIQQCGSCRHFHSPEGSGTLGYCIAHPPTAFFLGMVPVSSGPVINPNAPPKTAPMVQAFYPTVPASGGCHEHEPVERAN